MFLSHNKLIVKPFYHIYVTVPSHLVADKRYQLQRLDSIIWDGKMIMKGKTEANKKTFQSWQIINPAKTRTKDPHK